jgi:lipoprotein-releasing system ATP-binding protein
MGKSVIAVTHDAHFAAAADRRVEIVDGRLGATGP